MNTRTITMALLLIVPFAAQAQYTYLTNADNTITITSYNDTLSVESITNVINGRTVAVVGASAFSGKVKLSSVTIPNSVTNIGSQAFYNCTNLTSVTIGTNVVSIGSMAFDYCSALPRVTIPNSVTTIGTAAFLSCGGLTNAIIGANVTNIGQAAFGSACSSAPGSALRLTISSRRAPV